MNDRIHDFVAVGLGPFNLGLACLTDPVEDLNGVFLEQAEAFNWHSGMMLEDATLQTPFLADLVTLADPTSRFSFLNYIKQQGRIYSFYVRENFFLLRNEYNRYCQWAAAQLSNIRFSTRVTSVAYDEERTCYVVRGECTQTGQARTFHGRRLVLGTGTLPWLPNACHRLAGRVMHSSEYLPNKARLQRASSITVIGSGQSAAEIFHDLLQEIDTRGYALHWLTRSPRFFPMEYSKLTLEMTSPEYVDYFHSLPAVTRDRLMREQKSLYKGINDELITAIHETLYRKRLLGGMNVSLRTNCELVSATDKGEQLELVFSHREQDAQFRHMTAELVLATGYAYELPAFLENVADRIDRDAGGRLNVKRNYSVDRNGAEIFVQNGELHTHGFSAPDLGMGSYRNAWVIREMTGRDVYPIETHTMFQQFGVSEDEQFSQSAQFAAVAGGTS